MSSVKGRKVQIKSDNTTVVSYLNRQGGTRSAKLCLLTWQIYQWAIRNRIDLCAAHIPGEENVLADALSRAVPILTEWALDKDSFLWACRRMSSPPKVDLCATSENHQLPKFVAP